MKVIKQLLRKVDSFAVPITFRYKNEDKFSTSFGGFITIMFSIISISFGIYYFIPFITRKNYSLVYYTMKLPTSEKIKLKDSKAGFALGLECKADDNDGTRAEDILQLKLNYYIYKKLSNGTRTKTPEVLTSHKCTFEDFYNENNDSFDILALNNLECLDKTDHVIEGIFTDEIFSYYEFSVLTKEDTKENFDKIDHYLTENDCKFVMYYTDITFDLNNYKNPIKPFLNQIFIQLNPTLFLKMNAYFMNQYFKDDDHLLSNFGERQPITRTLYSREELYFTYKGLDRFTNKPSGYKNYMKLYIRADTRKTEVKRTYQKLMEFYADASSLLVALYEIIFFILTFINNFYLYYSVSKKVFLFKEVESFHFNISLAHHRIKNLISLTDPFKDIMPTTPNKTKRDENVNVDKKEIINALEKDDIKIININNNDEIERKPEIEKNFKKRKLTLKSNKKENKKLSILNKEKTEIQSVRSLKNGTMSLDIFNFNPYIVKSKVENFVIDRIKRKNEIKYTFNIFEIFANYSFFCCLSKRMKIKRELNLKAESILNNKFDIILYTRNMILLDILDKILLDQDKKSIINFLTRPTLTTENKVENEYDNIYSGNDFNNLFNEISNLVKKSDKLMIDKKLISLSNKKLKELI